MTKSESLKEDFKKALARLEEVLRHEGGEDRDIRRDSAIKRFELTFDLSWKLIKASLEDRGIACTSPLGCFREGYREKILVNDTIWMDMVKMRNETVHTYNLRLAEKVYDKLSSTLDAFQKLAEAIA